MKTKERNSDYPKFRKKYAGLLLALLFSLSIMQTGLRNAEIRNETSIQKAFWGLSKTMPKGSIERETFTDIGLGVTILFSAGGFVPGAIIGL